MSISVVEYYREAIAQLDSLTGAARANADRSMVAMAPGEPLDEKARLLATLDPSLPFFQVNANGNPTLVIPQTSFGQDILSGDLPSKRRFPLPPPPPPTTQAPAPATVPPTQQLATTPATPPASVTVPAGTPCPPGFVSTQPAAVPTVKTVADQVAQAFDTSGITQVSEPFGCQAQPVIAVQQPVTKNDVLRVDIVSIFGQAFTQTTTARILDCNNQIQTYVQSTSVPAVTLPVAIKRTTCMNLTDGYLLGVSTSIDTAGVCVFSGDMYVTAQIRTPNCSGNVSLNLFADYFPDRGTLGWPGGRFITPGEGPGSPNGASMGTTFNPAFGSTDGSIIRVTAIMLDVSTSAVAGNRSWVVDWFPNEAFQPLYIATSATQPPSTRYSWQWANGIESRTTVENFTGEQAQAFNGIVQVPIPANLVGLDIASVDMFPINADTVGDVIRHASLLFTAWAEPFHP